MFRSFLKAANALVSLIVLSALCVAGLYAGYALWDNSRVYAAAENVQADMLRLKPVAEEPTDEQSAPTYSFEELLAANGDVRAWVTLDNTGVDYPVLQGETNLTYINTDVYGNFALAGSIYLDTRNDASFADPYSLLYGHHMENGAMFGDLDLYKDAMFFSENPSGTLILPDGAYTLEIFACLLLSASDEYVFEPERWRTDDITALLTYAEDNALQLRADTLERLRQAENPRVLALSTCASEFTNARTIILAAMDPIQAADQEEDQV